MRAVRDGDFIDDTERRDAETARPFESLRGETGLWSMGDCTLFTVQAKKMAPGWVG